MKSTTYLRDTKKFWAVHEKARSALDKKRENSSLNEKKAVAKKVRLDMTYLKTGKIISKKP